MIALAGARNYASVGGGSLVREGRKVYVDATYGSDTTGAVNRGDFPFATLAAANAAAIAAVPTQASPINLHVRPGTYAHATGLLGDWMSLSAEGPQITTLNYAGDLNTVGPAFKIGNGTLVQGVSVVGTAAAGVFQALAGAIPFQPTWTVTPILMDVWWDGDSDGIYFDGANFLSIDLYRCRLKTKFDTIRSWKNTTIRAFNCELIALGPTACAGAVGNRIAAMDLGVFEMYGGTASVSGSPIKNTAWQTGGNANIRLFGVRWDGSGTTYNDYNIATGSLEISGSGRRDGAAITGVTASGGSVVYKDAESVVAAVNAGTTTIPESRLSTNVALKNANNNFSVGQTVTGTMTATTFSGSGASLTALPAANVTGSHTLPDGVLSTNVPLLNAANAFTVGGQAVTQNAAGTVGFQVNGAASNTAYLCQLQYSDTGRTKSLLVRDVSGNQFFSEDGGNVFVRNQLQLGQASAGVYPIMMIANNSTTLGRVVLSSVGSFEFRDGSNNPEVKLVRIAANVVQVSNQGGTAVAAIDAIARNFTVATLPTPSSAQAGRVLYATDARVSGQGAGAGTGSLVTCNTAGTAWQIVGTSTTAVA